MLASGYMRRARCATGAVADGRLRVGERAAAAAAAAVPQRRGAGRRSICRPLSPLGADAENLPRLRSRFLRNFFFFFFSGGWKFFATNAAELFAGADVAS